MYIYMYTAIILEYTNICVTVAILEIAKHQKVSEFSKAVSR